MKKIVARLVLKEGSTEQFLEYAKVMLEKTPHEEGCIKYQLFQELGNPNNFLFYEEYTNQEAVDLHNSSEYLKNFIEEITVLLAEEVEIDIF